MALGGSVTFEVLLESLKSLYFWSWDANHTLHMLSLHPESPQPWACLTFSGFMVIGVENISDFWIKDLNSFFYEVLGQKKETEKTKNKKYFLCDT